MKTKIFLTSLCLFLMTSTTGAMGPGLLKARTELQRSESLRRLNANLDHPSIKPGAVIASPSQDSPNYFFHWVRDAGLTMETFLILRSKDPDLSDRRLINWLKFESEIQQRSLQQGTTLGEPKYNVDGTLFTGPWGRPQNDGPAIRARTLILWAQALRGEGRNLPAELLPTIERDLNYTISHWTESNFDLWEEVKGDHFFTRLAQRSSLQLGANLFAELENPALSQRYRQAAMDIEKSLSEFWSDKLQLIMPTIRQTDGWTHKASQLDVAILLGSLYFTGDQEDFSLIDDRVLSSIQKLRDSFYFYEINQHSDTWVLGRYPEDVYDGVGFSYGHPWFLATAGWAEAQCRMAQAWKRAGAVMITPLNQKFLQNYLWAPARLRSGEILRQGDPHFETLIRNLRDQAQDTMDRVVFHAGRNGQMDEQFSRFNGYMRGAWDLSWSHSAFLRADRLCQF